MGNIEKVLMKRDGISERKAKKQVDSAREAFLSAIECGDFDGAEDVLYGDLGLEMDYIFDLI